MKTCTKCGEIKSRAEFSNNKNSRDGKSSACKPCINVYQHAYKNEHRELLRTKAKLRYNTNKEKCAKANKAWADKNKDKVLASQKAWVKRNPSKVHARTRRYQVSKLRAVPIWFDANKVLAIYERARERGLHVDHIVPLRSKLVCGLHVHTNLEALPATMNKSKGNRYWPDMP